MPNDRFPAGMKPARDWAEVLRGLPVPGQLEVSPGRGGEPTLKAGNVYLHSRYDPRREAARWVDAASPDPDKPVLVVGLGLGYHVLELAKRGFEVAVVEADPAVVKLALEGPMAAAGDVLLGLGPADEVGRCERFRAFAGREPQLMVHPPSASLREHYAEAVAGALARATVLAERLSIAVVGPMYGGSLPIAGYLERGFAKLGHRTLLVDPSIAWPLHQRISASVKTSKARRQLLAMLVNMLSEWAYAQVAEFSPEICVALAQAPLNSGFSARLAKDNIVTAFWFIENWRHLTYWQDVARHYDFFFHIQPGEFESRLDEVGCRHHAFVQTGCDPEIHRSVELTEAERREYGCDVSFAGAGYYNRNQMFSGLTDYDLKLWGVEWNAPPLQPFVCRANERFTPEQFAKIAAASKVNLNLHSSTSHPGVDPRCDAINPRVFELAACGAFQLSDPCIGLDRHFDFEKELPVYRDLAELRAKLDYYLARGDERTAIAQAARDRALRDHRYDQRAQQMIDLILDRHGGRLMKKERRVQRTVEEMAERAGKDSELGRYLARLPRDTLFIPDEIHRHVPELGQDRSEPEAILAYLKAMYETAASLLAERE